MDTGYQFNSDYSNDLIIGMFDSSFVAPNSTGTTTYTVEHGLSFVPLAKGSYSTSLDFNPTNEITNSTVSYSISVPEVQVSMFMDNKEITLNVSNTTGSDKTIYYRIYAFMPSDIDASVQPVLADKSDYVFNTDYKYLSVLDKNFINMSSSPVVVAHNLGYTPYVEAWASTTTIKYPLPSAYLPSSSYDRALLTANESTITFYPDTFAGINRYDYRIYK